MALDFHLAKTQQEAPKVKPSASLEYETHTKLFYEFGLTVEQYPMLNRIHDFYKDAHFSIEDLPKLKKELEVMTLLYSGEKNLKLELNGIIQACSIAEGKSLNLWAYCD